MAAQPVEKKSLQRTPLEKIGNRDLRMFFSSLIDEINKEYGENVKSIVLIGSSATNSWIQGKSDIDFIIVVEHKEDVPEVTAYTDQLILSLNNKYNLQLDKTCTTYAQDRNPLIYLTQKIESLFTFGTPFIVFSLDEIDFESNKLKNLRIRFITSFFDSFDIFVYKAHRQGLVLYGTDYLSEFGYNRSFVSKLQTLVAPLWILLVAFATVNLSKKFSISHANKATLWAAEDMLFALDRDVNCSEKNVEEIKQLFNHTFVNDHLERTLRIRLLNTLELECVDSSYLVDTLKFIGYCYPKVIHKVFKMHVLSQEIE